MVSGAAPAALTSVQFLNFTRVNEGLGVDDALGLAVAKVDGWLLADSVGLGVGVAGTFTPLFHTSLDPDFTQVNFLPPTVCVKPTLPHLAPLFAWTAAYADWTPKNIMRRLASANNLFMYR